MSEESPAAAALGPPAPPRPARVLVVDDDPTLRALLTAALTDEGYAVATAADGAAGLRRLRAWRPDLVLLDLMMPGLDGWGFRAAQLAAADTAAVPVVVLSAGPNLHAGVDALRATAILPKPFDLDLLLGVVAHLVAPRAGA